MIRRSPHGERGLKCALNKLHFNIPGSLPTRGAWIEMQPMRRKTDEEIVAPHTGSVD